MRSNKVSNLFYTGQLTYPGGGLPACLMSGRLVSGLVGESNAKTQANVVSRRSSQVWVALTDAIVSLMSR